MKSLIPWLMTLGRLLFAPAIILLVEYRAAGWLISLCILVELVLDIFDGIVARRLHVATSALRRADSRVDTVFYLAILYCAWTFHQPEVRKQIWWLAALVAIEALRYGFDYLKFRREAAYHMWSSKAWGLVLAAAVIALLGFNVGGWLLTVALAMGIVCDFEGLLISALLYESTEDVAHFGRALRLRRQQREEREPRGVIVSK
jgi:phosphatidylglycerophosphate synthase